MGVFPPPRTVGADNRMIGFDAAAAETKNHHREILEERDRLRVIIAELLEALQATVDNWRPEPGTIEEGALWEKICAAIAKAKGGA